MVENIADLKRFQNASNERKDYFMIVDREWNIVTEFLDFESASELVTLFGKIDYTECDGNGIRGLYINGEDTNYLLNSNGILAEIAIVSFDKNTKELVDCVKFNRNISVLAE